MRRLFKGTVMNHKVVAYRGLDQKMRNRIIVEIDNKCKLEYSTGKDSLKRVKSDNLDEAVLAPLEQLIKNYCPKQKLVK